MVVAGVAMLLADPVLAFAYPLCIVLVALGLLGRAVKSDLAFKGAMIGALLFSLLALINNLCPGCHWAAVMLEHLIDTIRTGLLYEEAG
mgnify:CR=1 FL=1